MATLYISVILLCRVVQAIFNKRSSNDITGFPLLVKYTTFTKAVSAVLALFVLVISGNALHIDALTFIISTLSGITLFFASFCSIYGMKSGTVSAVSMFGTAGLLIPLMAGIILFNQKINLIQWFGVAMFFVSAFLLLKSSKDTYSNFSIKTVFLLIGSLVSNGGTMLMQQMFTRYVPGGDVTVFSFVSFAVVAVLGLPIILIVNSKEKAVAKEIKMTKGMFFYGTALAVCLFIINQFATLCTAFVTPVILFTLINGGGTIISTFVAAILYKEKLTKKTVAGVLMGIISLVIIKAFS